MNNSQNLLILIFFVFLFIPIVQTNPFQTKLKSKSTQGSLILLEQKAKAIIQPPYATIEYIQTHKNPYDYALDIEFYFPLPENSLFHKFEAVFHNRTIGGKISQQDKTQEIIWRGNSATFSRRNPSIPVPIGMIQAHENVEIKFSFIQPLDAIMNQFWSFTLQYPFTEDPVDPSQGLNLQTMDLKHLCKEWQIEIEIKSDEPFSIIKNPLHHINPHISESDSKLYKAVWNTTVELNNNFIVYFRSDKMESPSTVLATHPTYPDDHVLLINFIPQLSRQETVKSQELLSKGEEGVLQLKKQVFEEDIQSAKGEFIFLVDCSSSMYGDKIKSLRKALQAFLEILPKDSFFNIISFGSTYTFYSRESLPSTPFNLWKARAWVNLLDSDMGSADFLPALQQATHAPLVQGYPRTIILLTNGIMVESRKITSEIKRNAHNTRVCDVRIGPKASRYLMEEIGKAGRCVGEFLEGYEDGMREKAMSMIHAAISPYLEEIQVNIDCFNSQNEVVFTEESQRQILLKNQPFKKWVYLRNIPDIEYCNATISYANSLTKEQTVQELKISNFKTAEVTSVWHKIAYNSKIDGLLENAAEWNFQWTERRIKELSTRYQIPSDYADYLSIKKINYPRGIYGESYPLDEMIEILRTRKFQKPFQIMEFVYVGFWVFFIYCYLSRKNKIKEGSRKENFDEIVKRLTHKRDE